MSPSLVGSLPVCSSSRLISNITPILTPLFTCHGLHHCSLPPLPSCPLSTSLLPHPQSFSSSFLSSCKPIGLSSSKPTGLSQPMSHCSPRLFIRAAATESRTIPLSSSAPEFELIEPLTGETRKLDDFEGYPALLVMFICNHCPFVVHFKADLVKLAKEYIPKGLAVVAISANSVKTHPQDGPDFMREEAKAFGYPFPYLYDETQEVAKAYGAACTPDFFLFKKDGRRPFELVYHGQFDDSRPNNNRPITGRDIRNSIDCVLSGRPLSTVQRPSLGCSIKWHPLH